MAAEAAVQVGGTGTQRSGQRHPTALRVLSRADGSAQWTQGNTSIIAAVYGPRQAQARKEDPERAVVEVTFRPLSGIAGSKEVTYESHIRQLLEGVIVVALHPRTCISVILQVEREDGSVLACAINAVCAALLDAAIPMKHMVAASACAVTSSGALLIDPDASEEEASRATVCCAVGHQRQQIDETKQDSLGTLLHDGVMTCISLGLVDNDILFHAVDLCRSGCKELAAFAVTSLQRSFQFKI